jgi:hypothetical protein
MPLAVHTGILLVVPTDVKRESCESRGASESVATATASPTEPTVGAIDALVADNKSFHRPNSV